MPTTFGVAAAYAALALGVVIIPHHSTLHGAVMAAGHALLAALYLGAVD